MAGRKFSVSQALEQIFADPDSDAADFDEESDEDRVFVNESGSDIDADSL